MSIATKRKVAGVSYFMIAAMAVILVALFGSFDRAYVAQDQEEFFYFYQGKKVPLSLSDEYVAIRSIEANVTKNMSSRYPEVASVAPDKKGLPQNLTLVKLQKGLSPSQVRQAYGKFRTDAAIELVAPAFKTRDALMIVSDQFIVQFAPDIQEKDVKALNDSNGVEVVEKVDWSENTYILRVQQGDALKTANRYAAAPGVIYSQPNFVRLLQNRPQMDQSSNGRMVFGKDGRMLPSDTVIPEGSTEYCVVENGSKKLPKRVATGKLRSYEEISPDTPVNKTTIKLETFESGFPTGWSLYGAPTWASTTPKAYEGTSSGYCVGSSVPPPGPYPNNANSWMVYGPFSLADADQAQLNLMAWVRTEVNYDTLSVMASVDDNNYYGESFSGNWQGANPNGGGWMNITLDLSRVYTLGNLCGKSTVYIALIFTSNSSNGYEGVYVDNVKIEKITGGHETLTSDEFSHLQWGLSNNGQSFGTSGADIAVRDAWAYNQGSDQAIVAIVDEGVDLEHPDIKNKLVPGYDATREGSNGAPSGNDAHGTNCAGIAAATTNNGKGVAGVARNAKIMPIRIAYSGDDGSWVTSESWIADGITWAVSNGAWVLSNSWGGGSASDAITNAITNAKKNGREGKGCLVAFSAGNSNGAVSYPANLSNVISVGALSPCNERKSPTSCDGEYFWGSNYGTRLDLMAPGVHMYSTDISGSAGYDTSDYYYNFNGTSSAAPVVSGIAGLILGTCPGITATELETALRQTAVDIGTTGVDPETGYGRVDANAAIREACFSSTHGALAVNLGPSSATGAQWRVDAGAWQNSGAEVTLSVGSHTVEYKSVTGYTAPAKEAVTITAEQTTTLTRTYTPTTGTLVVNLDPSTPTGARWRVDAGTWKKSGAAVSGLSAGEHFVTFKALPGWKKPETRTVTITAGKTKTVSAKYLRLPVVTMGVAFGPASEGTGGIGSLGIKRTGSVAKKLTINLTIGGTARNGVDYRRIGATATIPAGKRSVDIVVKPINDTIHEGKESVVITLKASTNYKISKPIKASMIIVDND